MTKSSDASFSTLLDLSKEMALLHSIEALHSWDMETYMPSGALHARSEQISLLNTLSHQRQTSKLFEDHLKTLIDLTTGEFLYPHLTDDQKCCLHNWRRDFLIASKIPEKLIQEESELTAKGTHIWAEARKKKDFSLFAPQLKKIVALQREKAALLGYEKHPYDALLDLYEPQMTTEVIEDLFTSLGAKLSSLLKQIKNKTNEDIFFGKIFPIPQQTSVSQGLIKALNLSPSFLRLDTSSHPFSVALHPTDCRITTRYFENDPFSSIFSTLHESGHAMYEHGLDPQNYGSPLSQSASYGIHESQSRIWETFLGKSRPFCKYLQAHMLKTFPKQLEKVSTEEFYHKVNTIAPSFIRVEADEVTYTLHIILRFQIEKALIEDSIKVNDLPQIWNAKMKELLGIVPPSDDLGVLQDIHWSMGSFGYFPSYALGNIYAGQLFMQLGKDLPNWAVEVEKGDFSCIQAWLKEKIHKQGKRFSPKELIENATHTPLSEKYYLEYLTSKFVSS